MTGQRDVLEDLIEALGDCKISFSAHCCSGLIGRSACQCWRCRGVDPAEEVEGWERASRLISEGFSSESSRWRKLATYPDDWPERAKKREVSCRRIAVEDFLCFALGVTDLRNFPQIDAALDRYFGMTQADADSWRRA